MRVPVAICTAALSAAVVLGMASATLAAGMPPSTVAHPTVGAPAAPPVAAPTPPAYPSGGGR